MKLGTYLRLRAVQKDESLDDRAKSMAIISIVENIQPADLRKMPVGKFDELAQRVAKSLDITPAEIKDYYIIGGVKCRLFRTIGAMTANQFSDLINTIKQGDTEANMATILSILLAPCNEKGDSIPYLDYDRFGLEEKIIEDFEIEDAISIANFIRGLSHVSQRDIVTSLILNEAKAWEGVPKWRRILTRKIVNILLRPSKRLLAKNGALLFGSTRSPSSRDAVGTMRDA